MRRPPHDLFTLLFGVAYLGLGTSALVVLSTLPLVVLLLATDPAVTWPAIALCAPLLAPALWAAFAVFRAFTLDGSQTVARTFLRAWLRGFRWSIGIGALASVAVMVLAVDIAWAFGRMLGAVAIPVFAMGIVMSCLLAVTALVIGEERPWLRRRDALRVGLFCVARRWYLSGANVLVAAVFLAIAGAAPALGLGVALAPLLLLVWANTRYAVTRELGGAARQPGAADICPSQRLVKH